MRIQFSSTHLADGKPVTLDTISDALTREKEAGRIADHVTFKVLRGIRSNTGRPAAEVQLEAAIQDRGRRAGNSGSYGAMRPEYDGYAATYDEWGWLLAALYDLDSQITVGGPRMPIYTDEDHFHEATGNTYHPALALTIANHGGDPYPYRGKGGRGWMIGRRGANRHAYDNHGWYEFAPRTADWATAFYAGEVY